MCFLFYVNHGLDIELKIVSDDRPGCGGLVGVGCSLRVSTKFRDNVHNIHGWLHLKLEYLSVEFFIDRCLANQQSNQSLGFAEKLHYSGGERKCLNNHF